MKTVEMILQIPDKDARTRLNKFATQALDRAEELKGIKRENIPSPSMPLLPTISVKNPARTQPHLGLAGSQVYTEEEKKVLEHGSHINSNVFVPFMSVDLKDKFVFSIPFTDKDGFLELAPKQKKDFIEWRRISEICEEPKLVYGRCVDFYSIKQTVISDCSLVASLAVAALYEKRFGRQLITSIIYPRNSKDEPIYNSSGKYSIKLHVNGVPRKVVIDDYLPIGRHNQLLCSYSNNKSEFWVSLLEKAYMKVMGGYDFPGSNSNIDLHALTGWIPERVAIRPKEADFNSDYIFERLQNGLAQGRCLITVATGELSDEESERTGLVATHAYAVLDLKEIDGVKLLQLKNPWSHLRWKGNYSELDAVHWTAELQDLLGYDPRLAAQVDNGCFWIDYHSILNFFDVFYLNWNPTLFQYTYCIHQYTLVVSQYEKTATIYYTLRAFCRDNFELKPLTRVYYQTHEIQGEWNQQTSGGCQNHPETYKNNPKYRINLGPKENSNLVCELRGPKVYQVGLELIVGSLVDPDVTAPFVSKVTGTYRSGFCVLDLDHLPAGIYYLIPSTYLPHQESPFILNFKASTNIVVDRVQ
ncbi:Calpain-7, partial [Pseudolycoriella hygida]